MSCNGENPMMGGRRRASRKSRKMRGGMGYGVGGAIVPGALEYVPSNTSVPMTPSGAVDTKFAAADTATNALVGGRRRKTKKGGKKSKKTKKGGRKTRKSRKMRGGAGVYNSAIAGTSFTGAVSGMPGAQTYGGYSGYNVANPAGNPHSAGADGVMQLSS